MNDIRPQSFASVYKAVMIGFGLIGAVMIGLLVRRLIVLVSGTFIAQSIFSIRKSLNLLDAAASVSSTDPVQRLINQVFLNVSSVARYQIEQNSAYQYQQALTYLVALASSIGLFLVASIIQLDAAHMLTCFIQYLLMLPSFINVLSIYSISNIHDVFVLK